MNNIKMLSLLCLVLITFSSLGSAQSHSDRRYDANHRRADRFKQDRSSVDRLDSNSSIWDIFAAHQKDVLNLGSF